MIRHTITTLILITASYMLVSCKHEQITTELDSELLQMAKQTNGFVWYKNQNILLPKSSGSGHPQPFLKTRYNAIAATNLDSSRKIISGVSFANGSLIIKELYNSSSELVRYAILYKQPNNTNADTKGWVWGYINADGSVAETAANKGKACISCHSQADNIDYMLMNKYFP